MSLTQEITANLDNCVNDEVRAAYQVRLAEGQLVREENIHSHFCAYFVPYNKAEKKILIGDHKKSGKWLMPGGHIDAEDNSLLDTINREIEEELGVSNFFSERPEPFLLSITDIETDVRPCQKHFDVWHLVETDGTDFKIDYTEYHEVRWVTVAEARELVVDPANLQALAVIEML